METKFKSEMLIYQPKANSDAKILFSTHLLDREIRKMLARAMLLAAKVQSSCSHRKFISIRNFIFWH